MIALALLDPEFSGRLCLALAHSVWQMALLALVGWLVERWRGRRSLEWAYGVHVGLLALGVIVTVATFAVVDVPAAAVNLAGTAADGFDVPHATPERAAPAPDAARSATASRLNGDAARAAPLESDNQTLPRLAATRSGALGGDWGSPTSATNAHTTWLRVAPWAAAMYALGVLAMLARLALAMGRARRLQRRAEPITTGHAAAIRDALVARWSMRIAPALAAAREIAVPMVVGLARPTILLPLAATTNLTPQELELILAHELAHIRRHDVWVNLSQRLVETALFFNPGMWRLSRRISALREYCCDESAASVGSPADGRSGGARTLYAEVLLRIAEMQRRHNAPGAALAVAGRTPSELRRRIARLFGEPLREPLPLSRGGAALVAAVVALALAGPALRPRAAEAPAMRRLQFPTDRAVGVIYTRPQSAGGFGWDEDAYAGWELAADARGAVSLPADVQVRFDLAKSASSDLAFLATLPPDVIQLMQLTGTDVDDDGLEYIGRLSGLEWLSLNQTRITDAGVQHLAGLENLKYLALDAFEVHEQGYGVGDESLGVIAFLPKLEHVSLRLTKVTDEGMARLAVLKSLKCVWIPGTKVTDAGLAHLARLPQLASLGLGVYDEGTAVTDDGMRIVGRMTNLRFLDLSATKVGDLGLKHLGTLTNLESLCIEDTVVTNEGLAALATFQHLKTFRAYGIGDGQIRDNGAAHLAKLPRLETIQANMELTNDGVIAIAKAPRLKALSLSHPQITDACCAALAAMPNLTELWLQNCMVTDAGLEQICRNQALEYLLINDAPITSEGLRHLKNLPKLVRLSIDMDVQEDRSPDEQHSLNHIGELTNLTDLDVDGFPSAELRQLAPLEKLTSLEIGDATIADDAALHTIGGLPNLERLMIHGSVATDSGVVALGRLSNLNYLLLSSLATDDGLAGLHGLKNLRNIQVASPYVTQGGLDRLAAALPSLRDTNKYNYRLEHSEVAPSTKDDFWRRGVAEERADRDALEDLPPPALAVEWKFNVEEKPTDPFGELSRRITLADLRGKVVLVHFWGAWCGPCRAQQPELDALHRKYADQGLEIVGVHSTSNAEQLPAFVEKFKIPWVEGVDVGKQSADAWKVDVYPSYYLIDRAGTLRIADIFRLHLEPAIQALLAEPAPPGDESPPSPQVDEEDAAGPPRDEPASGEFSIEVRPTTPDGRPAHDVYLTLWRELPSGPRLDDTVWLDFIGKEGWSRFRSAHPNDGRHSRDKSVTRFTFADLPPGRYRVTAMNYEPGSPMPDPSPYGVSEVIELGGNDPGAAEPHVVNIKMAGDQALLVWVIDKETRRPVEGVGIRLRIRDAEPQPGGPIVGRSGMPIVHGYGSGNFFERSNADGAVAYHNLPRGRYLIEVLGKNAVVNEFVEYARSDAGQYVAVDVSIQNPAAVEIPVEPRRLREEEIEEQYPFSTFGRVTDEQGQPLAGVEVRAATGMGTLTGGGRVTTDADGRYKLYFGAGWGMQRSETSPLGVGVQAAIITARKDGWSETNMNRQGDLRMTDQTPEQLEPELPTWGIETLDGFIFPRQPKEVNFTLTPAATLEGKLVHDSRELDGESLSLEGDELPPAQNVLEQVTTGDDGEFRIDGVPLGKKWRFRMRVGPTWEEIETEPFELTRPGVARCEVFVLTERTAFGAVAMSLHVRLLDAEAPAQP